MSEGHHTPEQVDKAFAYAPTILRKLKEAGVPNPHFRLFEDASGTLLIGNYATAKQCDLAETLIRSNRWSGGLAREVGINFCCGLVTAAEAAAEEELNL